MYFQCIKIVLKAILLSPYYWLKLYKTFDIKPTGILGGLKKSFQIYYSSKHRSLSIYQKYKNESISEIYSNDLRCGLVGVFLKKSLNAQMTYDTHELAIHRNRKNSFLRVVFDIIIEKRVISISEEIVFVNKTILDAYQKIYNLKNIKISIVYNTFTKVECKNYAYSDNALKNSEPVFAYVGAATSGRKLHELNELSEKYNIKCYGFFLKKVPDFLGEKWTIGQKSYLPSLRELIESMKVVMWCCTSDSCLSYKFSVSNKFFQSTALGIPVIAYKGTYLESIVRKYNLGYIYNGNNIESIMDEIKDDKRYFKTQESVKDFQNNLQKNLILL
jgi:glycosyltransferase involved in cell wall biosynthesis